LTQDFKTELLEQIQALRGFARVLCGNPVRADDLVQEALLKAWANKASYKIGTNMRAWLFTILRNTYYSESRRRKREVEDADGAKALALKVEPAQLNGLELRDLRKGLARLPAEQREALILVSAEGYSYEDAAAICSCAIGTIKSRVSRARAALLLAVDGDELERAPTEPAQAKTCDAAPPGL
jgi:RNA polymerase sigma-70 factor (ECF subfamily)